MNYKFFLGIGVAVAIVFAGVAVYTGFMKHVPAANTPERDTLNQVSTIDALMQGVYNGDVTVGELKNTATSGSAPSTSLMER